MWQAIRSGSWLTRQRLLGYSIVVLAVVIIASVIWIGLSDGFLDRSGKPIGTDFYSTWIAGKLVLSGQPAAPFDPALENAAALDAFNGHGVESCCWHYPPLFLAVAAGLAMLPYLVSLAVWMALTLAAYLVVVRAILPRPETILVALAFPATFVNLGHGQNGFLTAALFGGALLLLDSSPVSAGVLFGLLAYKPQFGLLIPLVLIASGRWRVFAAATVTVLAACAVTLMLFGADVWLAFFHSTTFTREVVMEQGASGWEKIQTLFAAVRLWGGGIETAYAAQGALSLFVAASLVWLWRSSADDDLKAAALPVGCLLAAPYVLDYDLVVLAIALAFYVRHALVRGFRDYEISLLALVWAVPLLTRTAAGITGVPLGLIATLAFYTMMLARAAELRSAGLKSPRLEPA